MYTDSAPRFYTDPAQWAEEVAGQYTVHMSTFNGLNRLLVADVDDTIVDSNLAWYEAYVQLANNKGAGPADIVPDAKTFAERSPRTCFTELELVPDYTTYKSDRMHDIAFHGIMKALGDAATVLPNFVNLNLPGAYLSTRPEVLGEVTKWHLDKLGMPPAPLLVRPDNVPYDQTISFKLTALRVLRHTLDEAQFTDSPLEYIDDYVGVVNAVNGLGSTTLVGTHFGAHTSWAAITQRILSAP